MIVIGKKMEFFCKKAGRVGSRKVVKIIYSEHFTEKAPTFNELLHRFLSSLP
jgi:hypothetical protein